LDPSFESNAAEKQRETPVEVINSFLVYVAAWTPGGRSFCFSGLKETDIVLF
jgi:hypothetical protein